MDDATPIDEITSALSHFKYFISICFETNGTNTEAPPPAPIICVDCEDSLNSFRILLTVLIIVNYAV